MRRSSSTHGINSPLKWKNSPFIITRMFNNVNMSQSSVRHNRIINSSGGRIVLRSPYSSHTSTQNSGIIPTTSRVASSISYKHRHRIPKHHSCETLWEEVEVLRTCVLNRVLRGDLVYDPLLGSAESAYNAGHYVFWAGWCRWRGGRIRFISPVECKWAVNLWSETCYGCWISDSILFSLHQTTFRPISTARKVKWLYNIHIPDKLLTLFGFVRNNWATARNMPYATGRIKHRSAFSYSKKKVR